MSKSRNQLALEIQEGACNPYAITHCLLDAIKDAGMGQQALDDPACRLMVHQLSHLFGASSGAMTQNTYEELMDHCRTTELPPLERIAQNSIEGMREIQTLLTAGDQQGVVTLLVAVAGILRRHGYEVPR